MTKFLSWGGWDMDGRGPTIWDTFCHAKGRVFEDHTGDVACNSYQLWEEDLKCIQQLGLTHYRLSISWSRLLPDGTTNHLNPKVIDDLIYHMDLPQAIQDLGRWSSTEIADIFESYARFCFKIFGDRVMLWITLNKPYICAKLGHEDGTFITQNFFALNYYTSRKVKDLNGVSKKNELSFVGDQGTEGVVDPSWPICGVHWLAIVPDGLRKLLKYIQDTYTSLPIYITENGFSQMGPVQIEVADCSHFYQDTLQEVGKGTVIGYFTLLFAVKHTQSELHNTMKKKSC
uniref:Glucosidase, beta, acid 3 (gene/pseudogene) n=1 Tax=Cyprinus carpio carpio TaxID=630221 RepID=A0A9J7ZMB3_CYPCA